MKQKIIAAALMSISAFGIGYGVATELAKPAEPDVLIYPYDGCEYIVAFNNETTAILLHRCQE